MKYQRSQAGRSATKRDSILIGPVGRELGEDGVEIIRRPALQVVASANTRSP